MIISLIEEYEILPLKVLAFILNDEFLSGKEQKYYRCIMGVYYNWSDAFTERGEAGFTIVEIKHTSRKDKRW